MFERKSKYVVDWFKFDKRYVLYAKVSVVGYINQYRYYFIGYIASNYFFKIPFFDESVSAVSAIQLRMPHHGMGETFVTVNRVNSILTGSSPEILI